MSVNKFLKIFIGSVILIVVLVFIGCEDEKLEKNEIFTTEENKFSKDLSDVELRRADLASVLPDVMTDPEIANIIFSAAKANYDDEPYALWQNVADSPTKSGKSLRQRIKQVVEKRYRGKMTAAGTAFTTALDSTDFLQIYIHGFKDWGGTSALPVIYTPLTINDVDVAELTLYDTLGNQIILPVDTTSTPDYPIAVVGLNESLAASQYYGTQTGKKRLKVDNKLLTASGSITITELNLDKSARKYEPWWLGKAEVYFVYDVPAERRDLIQKAKKGNISVKIKVSEEEWNLAFGKRTNFKEYKCWYWKKWRGYRQTKPWRTINLNTDWHIDDFDQDKEYALTVIEYDWPGYDRGADLWCWATGLVIFTKSGKLLDVKIAVAATLGLGFAILCDLIINDDVIGVEYGFEDMIKKAGLQRGKIFGWDDGDNWLIKFKVN